MRDKIIAGIDVSKGSLECKVEGVESVFSLGNTGRGLVRLVKTLREQDVALVVLEATGGYERLACKGLWASDIAVAVVNPRQVRAFAHSLGRRAKNDLIDAEILMEYGKRNEPQPTEELSEAVQQLRELLTRRNQLTRMLVTEKNHLAAPGISSISRKSINTIKGIISKEIKVLDKSIKEVIQESSILRDKSEKLSKETGVGPVLLCTLLAEMPELGRLRRNQASALVGVAPFDRDSGTLKGKRSIAGGRVRVRNTLYMATLAAIRHEKVLNDFYRHLVSKGKPRKVAIVACMRKFIIHLNTVLKEDPSQHFIVD